MSNEGILTRENTEQILRGVSDKSFFKGSLSKLSSGNTKQADENAPALVAMRDNYDTIGFGVSKQVQEEKMARAAEIVDEAEIFRLFALKKDAKSAASELESEGTKFNNSAEFVAAINKRMSENRLK